jgi:hypothetical protein
MIMKAIESSLALFFAGFLVVAAGCSTSDNKPAGAATNTKADSGGGGTKGTGKGSSAKTAAAAKTEKQKAGGKAEGAQSKAQSKGDTYEEITCDAETEDLGFCGDETQIVFCNGGTWYVLDCSAAAEGAFCGEEGDVVDCYVEEAAEGDPSTEEGSGG